MKVSGQTTALSIAIVVSFVILAAFQNCAPVLPLDGVVSSSSASVRATATAVPVITGTGTSGGGAYTGSQYDGTCDYSFTDYPMALAGTDNPGGKLIAFNSSTNAAIWNLNAGAIANAGVCSLGSGWQIVAIGDFDGDTNQDVAWRNTSTGEVVVWLMRGASRISTASAGILPLTYSIEGVADLNGDGKDDILLRTASGALTAMIMNGTAVTSLTALGSVSTTQHLVDIGSYVDNTGIKKRLLFFQNTGGGVPGSSSSVDTRYTIWYMNGTSIASNVNIPASYTYTSTTVSGTTTTATYDILGVGDFNGDGNTDLILQDRATTNMRMRYLVYATGATQLSVYTDSTENTVPVTSWVFQGVQSMNGDATSDWVYVINGGTYPYIGYIPISNGVNPESSIGSIRTGYTFFKYSHL